MGKESWGDLLSLWDRKKSTSCLCHTRDSVPDFWWRLDLFDSYLKLYNPKFALLFLSFLKTKHGYSQKGFCCTWRRDCFGRKRRAFDATTIPRTRSSDKSMWIRNREVMMPLNRDFVCSEKEGETGRKLLYGFCLDKWTDAHFVMVSVTRFESEIFNKNTPFYLAWGLSC